MSVIAQIIDKLSHAAVYLSPSGAVLQVNAPARDVFGLDLTGRHYLTVMRQPDLVRAIETALRTGSASRASIQILAGHDSQVFDVTCDPIEDQGGCVFVQLHDTTDQDQTIQMRRDFVANVSHELKTPLTALNGFIETLQGPAKNDTAARDRFLSIMEQETDRMTRLVDDLLSLSKVERDQKIRPTAQIDVGAVLGSVVNRLEPHAKNLEMPIRLTAPDTAVFCTADEDQIRQVFSNLIENGLKYGRSARGLDVHLNFPVQDVILKGGGMRVDFIDYGAGFDPIHIPRLGERFYRIDGHRARAVGGTGLGLAIVKHILKRHRGGLKISSKIGGGSIFSVYLPRV
ncbi:ATP-binding protein [Algirhabdus cladophorae]|uniref:ATP-binding protein n=1 Tax=Algirhabdus cladophorae TaxID=3377108 RepID=UPI003B8472E7